MASARRGGQRLHGERVASGRRAMAGLEGRAVRGGVDVRHPAAVPGDGERPDRRIDVGVGVGQADLDEDLGPESGGGRGGQVGEGGLDGRVGRGGIERVVHAVISSSS